jgi:SNF2 family DNA or RNA helicase
MDKQGLTILTNILSIVTQMSRDMKIDMVTKADLREAISASELRMEKKTEEKLEQKLEEKLEQKLDEKLKGAVAEIISQTVSQTVEALGEVIEREIGELAKITNKVTANHEGRITLLERKMAI